MHVTTKYDAISFMVQRVKGYGNIRYKLQNVSRLSWASKQNDVFTEME